MQSPGSTFAASAKRWVWNYEGEELAMDAGSVVRFKVQDITFHSLDDAMQSAGAGTSASHVT
jgi:DNA-directed RNA polymerase subunit E'/Rpb7